jgi:hypothetical protein
MAAALEVIVVEESCTEMETSANSDDDDNVPIAQQLGHPQRLQKSGDALHPLTHLPPPNYKRL